MSLIDLGKTSQILIEIETIFSKFGLNSEEKTYMIQKLNERQRSKQEAQKVNDLTQNLPFTDLMKRLQDNADSTE